MQDTFGGFDLQAPARNINLPSSSILVFRGGVDEYTLQTYILNVEILETSRFVKLAGEYMDEDGLDELKLFLAISPDVGVVIPGSGGCRKLRWRGRGRGKRGGNRIIYFYKGTADQLWLLTMYAKNEVENLSPAILKKWKQEIEP